MWAMKKKSNGTCCGRRNDRVYEQIDGIHYALDSIATPVTPITIHLILMQLCMNTMWMAVIINVEGAFLHGRLENGEKLYIAVPYGFEE